MNIARNIFSSGILWEGPISSLWVPSQVSHIRGEEVYNCGWCHSCRGRGYRIWMLGTRILRVRILWNAVVGYELTAHGPSFWYPPEKLETGSATEDRLAEGDTPLEHPWFIQRSDTVFLFSLWNVFLLLSSKSPQFFWVTTLFRVRSRLVIDRLGKQFSISVIDFCEENRSDNLRCFESRLSYIATSNPLNYGT